MIAIQTQSHSIIVLLQENVQIIAMYSSSGKWVNVIGVAHKT